jgi:hypothetical protein
MTTDNQIIDEKIGELSKEDSIRFSQFYDQFSLVNLESSVHDLNELSLKHALYFIHPFLSASELQACPKCCSLDLRTHGTSNRLHIRRCLDCGWESDEFIRRTPLDKAITASYYMATNSHFEIIDGFGNTVMAATHKEPSEIKAELERYNKCAGGPYRAIVWPQEVEVKGKLIELNDFDELS